MCKAEGAIDGDRPGGALALRALRVEESDFSSPTPAAGLATVTPLRGARWPDTKAELAERDSVA